MKIETTKSKKLSSLIWNVADLLRGEYRQSDYGKVILPLTVLRRLDCVLKADKKEFLEAYQELETKMGKNAIPEKLIASISKHSFYNTSRFTFETLLNDPNNIKSNFKKYIDSFSDNVKNIIGNFDFKRQIDKLDASDLLYQVLKEFISSDLDLHPNKINNTNMGYAFEELIRKFSELSNETAGEHFTPREVIKLMVNMLFSGDKEAELLAKPNKIIKIYDPACGTGGMLSVSDEFLKKNNSDIKTVLFGQELNPESYATCKSDMLIKGQDAENIKLGNSFTQDGLPDEKFNYMLCNPPFGVSWKKVEAEIKDEKDKKGYSGRFGAGLPRINDGSLLFLQHMLSKMQTQENDGSRIGIIFNGSPLFTGSAGSGESDIRRWIIENDWLEAVVGLPNDLFYNTGIATYIWIVTNRKEKHRKGKVQLINAVSFFKKMKKSLGNKRNELSEEQIDEITKIYSSFKENKLCKILDNDDLGYENITVEVPLMEKGKPVKDKNGKIKADKSSRDSENIPLKENIEEYFKREVLPHLPNAWYDKNNIVRGYEIPFTRFFYEYVPPRALREIESDLSIIQKEILELMKDI